MRIGQSFGPVGAGLRRESGRVAASDGFADRIGAGRTSRSTGASAPAPLATLGAVLAAQAAEDPLLGRRRAREHGKRMLDALEELQAAMLDGRLHQDQLARLRKLVTDRRERSEDVALESTLDAIELRSAVELAKLDRRLG